MTTLCPPPSLCNAVGLNVTRGGGERQWELAELASCLTHRCISVCLARLLRITEAGLCYFLLKTFSTSPFQGQYPTKAVTINETPTTIDSGIHNPVTVKPKGIRATPSTVRTILSILGTFLVIAIKCLQCMNESVSTKLGTDTSRIHSPAPWSACCNDLVMANGLADHGSPPTAMQLGSMLRLEGVKGQSKSAGWRSEK